MEPSDCLYLSPGEIHYSQDTISAAFHDGVKIGHTLDSLVNMETFVTDIPPITVVKHNDKYFTRNNRRLWVFRQLSRMGHCEFIPTILSPHLPSAQFTTDIDGYEVLVRGENGSTTLRDFEQLHRGQTIETIKSTRLCPITPSFRCKLSPRFRQDYRKRRNSGTRRNILRGKRRLQKSRDPGFSEPTAFDFSPYDVNAARIEFAEQRDMVFGNGAMNGPCGDGQFDYQPSVNEHFRNEARYGHDAQYEGHAQTAYINRSGPMANGPYKNEQSECFQTNNGHFGMEVSTTWPFRYMQPANRNASSTYSDNWHVAAGRGTPINGSCGNVYTDYGHTTMGHFPNMYAVRGNASSVYNGNRQMARGPPAQWTGDHGSNMNGLPEYRPKPKRKYGKRKLDSLVELRVYGAIPQADEDFAFNRFESRI